MRLETIQIAELRPHPRNYVQHPSDQLAHLAESIRAHGFYRNIIIAQDNTILAGHGAVQAAALLGLVEVPAHRLDLDPLDPRALKVLAAKSLLDRKQRRGKIPGLLYGAVALVAQYHEIRRVVSVRRRAKAALRDNVMNRQAALLCRFGGTAPRACVVCARTRGALYGDPAIAVALSATATPCRMARADFVCIAARHAAELSIPATSMARARHEQRAAVQAWPWLLGVFVAAHRTILAAPGGYALLGGSDGRAAPQARAFDSRLYVALAACLRAVVNIMGMCFPDSEQHAAGSTRLRYSAARIVACGRAVDPRSVCCGDNEIPIALWAVLCDIGRHGDPLHDRSAYVAGKPAQNRRSKRFTTPFLSLCIIP